MNGRKSNRPDPPLFEIEQDIFEGYLNGFGSPNLTSPFRNSNVHRSPQLNPRPAPRRREEYESDSDHEEDEGKQKLEQAPFTGPLSVENLHLMLQNMWERIYQLEMLIMNGAGGFYQNTGHYNAPEKRARTLNETPTVNFEPIAS